VAYEIVRSRQCDRDLSLIFDHLFRTYVALGEPDTDAFGRAVERIRAIEGDMFALARAPHQGTLRSDVLPGLRQVTKHQAIFYFENVEEQLLVRVLAVFFGGQDHQRHMLKRLSGM
jgi:plasmid stabilization system protein ParE